MRQLAFFLFLAVIAGAEPRHFASGPQRTVLLELFSSEGCSSCPPAEEWLGRLRDQPGLWRDFVPVAWPVDYWNRLGWTDRWSRPEYTARQYGYASRWRADSVYTPQFVVDGAEWRGSPRVPAVAKEPAPVLEVAYDVDSGRGRIVFAATRPGTAEVALLGAGITSRVRAGENSGKTLRHDFVALATATAKLTGDETSFQLTAPTDPAVPRRALAVWVTNPDGTQIVQATGGWLND